MASGSPFQLIDVLTQHNVPVVIVGGHAVSFHGYVRATEDTLDSAVVSEGRRFVSIEILRQMKAASGRAKDLLDLENLE